jgi:hypothetical protein
MPWMRGISAIALMVILDGSLLCDVARAAETALAEEALERLQVSAEQRQRLLRGEVISYPVSAYGERELAVGLAVLVMAPLGRLAEYLAAGDLLAHDATISAHGLMPDPTTPGALPAVRFTASERDEADSLLEAAPGTKFNLSSAEIQTFRSLRALPAASDSVVSDEYRRLLRDRWQAYQRAGLAAIPPYARGGGTVTDPAAELRRAVSDAEPVARYGTQLRDALARYPAAQPPQAINRFYWIKRRVQRRPDLSLLHQMVMADPDVVVHVERYFYVGHSYNAAQIITGAVAYQEGAMVFATSRFSTDEVLGLGNQLKRSVGRSQLRDEMRKRLEGVRLSLRAVSPSPQSP